MFTGRLVNFVVFLTWVLELECLRKYSGKIYANTLFDNITLTSSLVMKKEMLSY